MKLDSLVMDQTPYVGNRTHTPCWQGSGGTYAPQRRLRRKYSVNTSLPDAFGTLHNELSRIHRGERSP